MHKITCDSCDADLTFIGHRPGYRISVTDETNPPDLSFRRASFDMTEPSLPLHFCNAICLAEYLKKKSEKAGGQD